MRIHHIWRTKEIKEKNQRLIRNSDGRESGCREHTLQPRDCDRLLRLFLSFYLSFFFFLRRLPAGKGVWMGMRSCFLAFLEEGSSLSPVIWDSSRVSLEEKE